MVSADGTEQPIDPAGALPALEDGEYYRLSLTLPEGRPREEQLSFQADGLEAALYLDGQQVWYSVAVSQSDSADLGAVQLSLPAGGGEALTLTLRPAAASSAVTMPPALYLSNFSGYGLPAEMSTRILILFWGLFLMSMARGQTEWRLVLPLLAVIPLMVDGSVAPGTCLALYLFTCGAIFPLVLQLAVYNKKSAPLNETVNVKSSNVTGINTLITMVALFVPSLLLTLLCLLILRLMRMGERQEEPFGRIYCYCVASILLFHVLVNVGMTIGLMPVMGIPLPFMSYGGSSLIAFTILLFIAVRLDASTRQFSINKF